MFKLCVLIIVVAAANCQQPAVASQAASHSLISGRHHRSRLHYDYPINGRIQPHIYIGETPKPYSFSYAAADEDGIGSSRRHEVADASGRVQGSYSLTNDEGHLRSVHYTADKGGFRAHIWTNEPGTDNQNPADVVIESHAPHSHVGPHIRYGSNQHLRLGSPVGLANAIVAVASELRPVPVRAPLPGY